jgi:antibiotic biosynthesis monooxygenase (ABM) superfamily enzyme
MVALLIAPTSNPALPFRQSSVIQAPLDIRRPRSSSVIVQRVSPGSRGLFLEWQRGVTQTAESFPGYQGTEVYPPANDQGAEWVIVIHFDDSKCLQAWLNSRERAEWTAKLPSEIQKFELKMLPSGFAPWFAGLVHDGEPLPHWKMFLTVLFALYPTVVLLTVFLVPHTQPKVGLALAVLINNIISVSLLEWLGMPVIRLLFAPWLGANSKADRARSLAGMVLIVAAIGVMVAVFRQLNG